ncbi:MAG: phage major tail tube protein [Vibrio sp.]
MSKSIRKYNGVYLDGVSKVSDVTDYTPPVLELLTEEWRAGGMFTPTHMVMGMAALSSSFVAGEDIDFLKRFGVIKNGKHIACFVKGSLEDDLTGTVTAVEDELRGKLTKVDRGTFSPGSVNLTTYEFSVDYYRYAQDGKTIHEIDPPNMVCIIDGVDLLADHRAALGF